MQRHELEHIIRASAGITGRNRFIIGCSRLAREGRLTRLSALSKL